VKFNTTHHKSLILWILSICAFDAIILFFILPLFLQHFPGLYQINFFPDGYDLLASNILAGNGYRFFPDTSETLLRTPGYPLLLTLIFYFFPNSLVAVKIVNLTLGLFTAWMVAILTWRLTTNKPAATWASLLFLIHPAMIFTQSRGGVESLFTLLTTGFVLALCQAFDREKIMDFVVSGILLGMATLVKSTTILFPAFLFGCILLTRNWHSVLKYWLPRFALLVISMFFVLAPWMVRNYLVTHQFIPTMTIEGTSATHGLYVCKNFSFKANMNLQYNEAAKQLNAVAAQLRLPHREMFFQYFYNTKDEVRFNQYLLKTVYDEYRKSPALLARCSLQNIFNFWFAGRTWKSTILNILAQTPYLILSALGIHFCIRRGYLQQMLPILSFAAYFYIIHLPIIALARYSVPLIPFLGIFSGIAIEELRIRWRTRSALKTQTRHYLNKFLN
jgi:Dolichyl-phosphate-mannose-protein mannosyltransferase